MSKFNKKLDDAIFESGLSREDIANQAGINVSTLSRIVNGRSPNQRTRRNVADVLNKDVKDLGF